MGLSNNYSSIFIDHATNPQKGEAYRIYFPWTENDLHGSQPFDDGLTNEWFISKDGSSFVPATNIAQTLDESEGIPTFASTYLDLSASEMNANQIVIRGRLRQVEGSESLYYYIVINTAKLGATPTNLSTGSLSAIIKSTACGYNLSKLAFDENGYNYFGLVQSKLWLIIKEATDYTSIEYRLGRESKLKFLDQWELRESLSYDSSEPTC